MDQAGMLAPVEVEAADETALSLKTHQASNKNLRILYSLLILKRPYQSRVFYKKCKVLNHYIMRR